MTLQKNSTGSAPEETQLSRVDEDELDIAEYLRTEGESPPDALQRQRFSALLIGAVGVVYGDIGTSPIYAFREALRPISAQGVEKAEVLGLLSLLIWTLIIIVTLKYVLFLLRADNRGEGGVLALYTLVRLAIGRRSVPVLCLSIAGAALFAGDAIITPAISVLSAVEGTKLVIPAMQQWVVPLTLVILLALFLAQQKGTAFVAGAFGPITVVWFLTIAGLGVRQIIADPAVLAAFNPVWGGAFLFSHSTVAFIVLGAIFLSVTGAEALYADLGHFGRKPIMAAWFILVFPALVLNYLGQGALVLQDPTAIENPFFGLAPEPFLPFLVVLATAATVIAAQAVISGAFSMARSAIQLGMLPRMKISHTSSDQSGQIYIGAVNWGLLVGVVALVLTFKTSGSLAAAYGIAVTGTMVITSILAILYLVRSGLLSVPVAILLGAPIVALELTFLASNATKLFDGGYVPVVLALILGIMMWAWWRGTQIILAIIHKQSVDLHSFVKSMGHSSVHVIPGTAFFLTPDQDAVPSALLHNIKHNRVLHDQTVLLTVETMRVPYATAAERANYESLGPHFARVTLRFGFMETPNVSRAMVFARRAGLRFDVMSTSFFLGRRRAVVTGPMGIGRLLDRVYAVMAQFSADPSDFYYLPRDRVVELGERVAI